MDVVGVIPARYASTRFEGKVLVNIDGKPMIQHVWERARQSRLLDQLIIACDDPRVCAVAREFGATAVMTARGHSCGTDRIAEVVNPLEVKVVVNIQADEPLVHPSMIDSVARVVLEEEGVCMATLKRRTDDPAAIADPNVVKVVTDKNGFALYFSRAPIPYRAHDAAVNAPAYYRHIGLYGYSKDFLFTFKNLSPSGLERTEKLEQLRVLEEGYRIRVIETKYESIGVDTPEDLARVKAYLQNGGA